MVSGVKGEGSAQILSAGVRKTIQQIKEIVGKHSDADIYVALKETNMDPNETTQKLLNQDPFREVKRKKDKKKENTGFIGSTAAEPRQNFENVGQGVRFSTYSDRNVRRTGYSRNSLPRVSREFRVVRDNRINQNANKEVKPAENSSSSHDQVVTNVSARRNSAGISIHQRSPFGHHGFQHLNGPTSSQSTKSKDGNSNGSLKKDSLDLMGQSILGTAAQMQASKASDSQLPSTASSNNSVVGVYSSSSDPVHVPSPDSRSAAKVGAIKREVGVVGAHRQNSDASAKLSSSHGSSSAKLSSPHGSSLSSANLGREGPSSRDALRSVGTLSKNEHLNTAPEHAIPNLSVSKSFSNNQQSSRSHQLVGHQKASLPNKEWKPKSSQKSSANGPGVIGMPKKAASHVESTKDVGIESALLEDKMSRANTFENKNVIIAAHIRVSETDRSRLTFGTLGSDFETRKSGYQVSGSADEPHKEPSGCFPVPSSSESSSNDTTSGNQLELIDDHVRNSCSGSPVSVSASELQRSGKREVSPPESLDNFADIRLVQETSQPYVPPESQQQDASELQSFSAYDPQTGYEISYFRPTVDEHVRGQGLQEALSSHPANNIPSSSMATVQQQQQQQQQAVAQMYPQLHVSPFPNLMPYRQFMSPLYVPPMAVPGYSGNAAAYPHPSNGSSYVLMPGSSSHLTASGLKYGIQQFKPLPTGSPSGFGNFTSPAGYAVSTPGVVGSATGLEDTSRIKYKDGNLYVPNPQAETSEMWMNPRDLQSAAYYNLPGQTPHAAYLPPHSGHTSFNAAAAAQAQSSHMQFPGLYHAPLQAGAMGNPHHLGPAMGGNVGVASATPGAQVGAYQQPPLGHISWTGNF